MKILINWVMTLPEMHMQFLICELALMNDEEMIGDKQLK